jgi:hypothetical protein
MVSPVADCDRLKLTLYNSPDKPQEHGGLETSR